MEAATAPKNEQSPAAGEEKSARRREGSDIDRQADAERAAAVELARSRAAEANESARRTSEYVVLVNIGSSGWAEAARVTVAGGQREARGAAIKESETIRKALDSELLVELAAVPRASWQPQTVKVEQPPPKIVY